MDWTKENIMKFLELYQMHPCIWDHRNSLYKNKTKINDAWIDIQNNMGHPWTIKDLKKKRESLMAAYRGYKTKVRKSGAGASDPYQPVWFAYEYMDSFLGVIYNTNSCMENKDKHNHQDAEYINNSQVDTGDENNTASISEEECLSRLSQSSSSSSEETFTKTTSPKRRRQHDPPEFHQLEKKYYQPFGILNNVAQTKDNDEEEDECSIFGKLVAKKLRKLTEDRRDLMMIKISQLFYEERQKCNRPHS